MMIAGRRKVFTKNRRNLQSTLALTTKEWVFTSNDQSVEKYEP